MTDGPLRCLKFLLGLHADEEPRAPGIERICRAVGAPSRPVPQSTVRLWLKTLAVGGAVKIVRGGDSNFSNIRVVMSLGAFLSGPKNKRRNISGPNPETWRTEPEKLADRNLLNLKEVLTQEREAPVENFELKPEQEPTPQPELTAEDRKTLAELRGIYPFASCANLLEALAESKATPKPAQREERTEFKRATG